MVTTDKPPSTDISVMAEMFQWQPIVSVINKLGTCALSWQRSLAEMHQWPITLFTGKIFFKQGMTSEMSSCFIAKNVAFIAKD